MHSKSLVKQRDYTVKTIKLLNCIALNIKELSLQNKYRKPLLMKNHLKKSWPPHFREVLSEITQITH